MTTTLLAVNGTLMRGLELNPNMQKAGGIFVREDRTDAHYRLWSINDRHPGMIRVNEGGTHVDVEIWQLPLASFAALLMSCLLYTSPSPRDPPCTSIRRHTRS
ncbi:allophanate hydrolase-related protein [Escherichia coli]